MVVTRRMASKEGGTEKVEQNVSKQIKKIASNGTKRPSCTKGWFTYKEKLKTNIQENWLLLTDPSRCSWWPFPTFLLIAEAIVNMFIIQNVSYTEIDWKAYMQVMIFEY